MSTLKCGLYEVDITPALGMEMPGHFQLRHADGILEKLYAYAAWFEDDEGGKTLICTMDTITVLDSFGDDVRQRVADKLGLDVSAVMVCATHTHYGGPVETWGDFVHVNPAYLEFLATRIVDAATLAKAEARPVRIGYGAGEEHTVAHYRDFIWPDGTCHTNSRAEGQRAFGPIDPQVGVLRIDNADGTPYGLISNYACHCDSVGGNGFTKYSSDYPGSLRETLRKTYGPSFMPLFINGFCGDINHVDFENGTSSEPMYYRKMGRILAAVVSETYEKIRPAEGGTIKAAASRMTFDSRMPTAEELAWADAHLNDESVIERFYATEARRMKAEGVEKLPAVVQAIRIGDMILYGMPGEIYVEFALMLKERTKDHPVMTANLANGCLGYVPIRELFQPGVYESRLCSSAHVRPDTGYQMVDELMKLSATL